MSFASFDNVGPDAFPRKLSMPATDLLFVNYAPNRGDGQRARVVRAHVARASAAARLETIRKRASERPARRGRRVLAVHMPAEQKESTQSPSSTADKEERQQLLKCCQGRDTSVTLQSHKVLGGSIPMAQLDSAALAKFLERFKNSSSTERPWIEMVTSAVGSSAATSLVATALQANACALCANDLDRPDFHSYATRQYLSAIVQLQAVLKSPRWAESVVLYTSMILSLFECIRSTDINTRHAHIRGVAQLIRQRGPHSFASGLEHKTFRYYRINILMAALVDRQPSFLSEVEWKIVPFSGDGPPKTTLDLLLDTLLEFPGLLAAIESVRKGCLSQFALIQKAWEIACWVKRLIHDLEKWKQDHIWTHPAISATPHLKNLKPPALCELSAGLSPYDSILGEAVNCYCAAHLILARIVWGMAQRSLVIAVALRSPFSIQELVHGTVALSKKHISANTTGMISLVVTAFALKVVTTTTEVDEPLLFKEAQELLDQLNASFARKFNIKYSVPFEARQCGT